MAFEVQGKAGLVQVTDGSLVDPFLGPQAQMMTADWAPRYSEMARRGLLFNGGNQATSAITNLATTATGLILINPLGSGKNLWIVDMVIVPGVNDAGVLPALGVAANGTPLALSSYTLTTPLTVNSALVGAASTSVARLLSAATLPSAPAIIRQVVQIQSFNVAPTTGSNQTYIRDEMAGAVGVAPGCAISITSSAAFSALSSFTWAELPQ